MNVPGLTPATPASHARARVTRVPSRALAATLTFGAILGLPALLGTMGAVAVALELEAVGLALFALGFAMFVLGVVAAWVFIFQARGRLQRAERALFAGDLDAATREARVVVATVFRADYQLAAVYTLALAAEHLGAFAEATALYERALFAVPAFAAPLPARRVRALVTGHAALTSAAAGDMPRAEAHLTQCFGHLGDPTRPDALTSLLKIDDSGFGTIGINTLLRELENGRDPRPVAVLASALVAFRAGRMQETARLLDAEQVTVVHGLAGHERALAMRLRAEAVRRLASGGSPHRAPAALVTYAASAPGPEAWAALVVGG